MTQELRPILTFEGFATLYVVVNGTGAGRVTHHYPPDAISSGQFVVFLNISKDLSLIAGDVVTFVIGNATKANAALSSGFSYLSSGQLSAIH